MSVPPFSRLPRRWRAVVLPLSTLAVLVVILTIRRETPPSSPPTSGGSASPTAAVKPKPTRQATAIAVPSAIADAASEGGRPDSRSEAVSRAPRSPGWQRPEFGSDWGAERHPALRAFSAWVERRRENGVWSGLAEGARLAEARRAALADMLLNDPETAVRSAVPLAIRGELPPPVSGLIEDFVEGTGDFQVGRVCFGETPLPTAPDGHLRNFTLGDATYRTGVYGERLATVSTDRLPAHGIAIGGRLAIEENAVRPVSPPNAGPVTVVFGGTELTLADAGAAARLADRQLALETTPGANVDALSAPAAASPKRLALNSNFTLGTKDLLVIRVDFSDRPGTPVDTLSGDTITPTWAANAVNGELSDFFTEFSYGKFDVATTAADVTPVYRLPRSAASYNNGDDWDALATHAKNAAANGGYSLASYHHYVIVFKEVPAVSFAGIATLGSRDYVIINGYFDSATVAHEIGHNLGLEHANLWSPNSSANPVGAGHSEEYGDAFDVMGSDNWLYDIPEDTLHPNPWFLEMLGWLEPQSIQQIGANDSGTYRVYRFDTAAANPANTLALRVFRKSGQYYWIGLRDDLDGHFSDAADMAEGAYIVAEGFNAYDNSNLVDLGGNPADFDIADASLNVGETFVDPAGGLAIEVLQKGGSGAATYLDLLISVPQVPVIDPVVVPAATVSGAFSLALTASENPGSFRVHGLPSGLTYNRATGEISGVPNRAGTFTVTAYASNGVGRSEPLQFTLVVDPLDVDQTGKFAALVDSHAVLNDAFGGRLDLKVNAIGTCSGGLWMGRERFRFRGRLDATPGGAATLERTINRRGRSALILRVTIDANGLLAGTVEDAENAADIVAAQGEKIRWHGRLNPATDYTGAWNAALTLKAAQRGDPDVPQGAGYLRLTVGANGLTRWSGRSGDGVPFSGANCLFDGGELPFYTLFRGGAGSLREFLAFDSGAGTVAGMPWWIRVASTNPRARLYRDGFGPFAIDLRGAKFAPPLAGELLLGAPGQADNATLAFSGGDVESADLFADLAQTLAIDARHRGRFADGAGPVNPARVTVAIDPRNGMVTGRFVLVDPNPFNPAKTLRRTAVFRGIVVPGNPVAAGHFQLPGLGDPLADPVETIRNSPVLSGLVELAENP